MALPHFLVSPEALSRRRAVLIGPELHHLRVRRLRVGCELVLSDGMGHQRRGILDALGRHQAIVRLAEEDELPRESGLHLILAQACLKGHKLDLVVEKATELGVTEFLMFTCEHAVSHIRSDRHLRWQRVARSAAKQCHRSTVPRVAGPVHFADVLQQAPGALRLFFWERAPAGGLPAVQQAHPTVRSVLAVVGPEGGFTQAEAGRAAAAGFQLVGLVPRVLRAETAALAVATLCQFLWGDLAERSV
ncbi:MAG: RsmE family RNA methyltransferase [Candidatus Binatia bacterium]